MNVWYIVYYLLYILHIYLLIHPLKINHSWVGKYTYVQSQGIVGCTPTNVPLWEIPI